MVRKKVMGLDACGSTWKLVDEELVVACQVEFIVDIWILPAQRSAAHTASSRSIFLPLGNGTTWCYLGLFDPRWFGYLLQEQQPWKVQEPFAGIATLEDLLRFLSRIATLRNSRIIYFDMPRSDDC
jgi:hypothetical protein